MFRKIILKLYHFHRVKKKTLQYIQNKASICYHGNEQKKYYLLNGSTYIALLSYFIKVYITYAMFLVYLVQKLYYST